MNQEQLEFINSPLQDSCLIGIPGGGKTTTIIHKIINHLNKKELTKQDFMIITFSKKACHDFIERGEHIIKDTFTKNNVKTIHSLSGTIVNNIDKSKSDSIEIVICKALNYIVSMTTTELKKIKCLKSMKLLIIDEAQDISDIQYNLAKILSEKMSCALILVGDPNQNIYQFQKGTDKYLLEHSKNKFYLRDNYRSTPELVNLINAMKPWKNIIPNMRAIKPSINKKPIIYSSNLKNIMKHFMETIIEYKKNNIDYRDIAIIGPVKKSKENQFGKFNNIGLQYFVNYFEDNNIPYVKHYSETTSDAEIVNSKSYAKDGHINLYTIHGSKGLEFKKVFLLNFHTNTYGRNPTMKEYNNFKYLWYVGLSRACEELIIYCDYNKNIWYELAKCPNNLYKFIGKQLKLIEPIFEKNNNRPSSVTELIKSKEIFTEEILLELKEKLNFIVTEEIIYKPEVSEIKNFEEYSSLYGKFIEQLFEYLYCKKFNRPFSLLNIIKNFINNRICLQNKYRPYLQSFMAKINKPILSLLELESINEIKNSFNDHEREIYEEIIKILQDKNQESFSIYIPNNLIYDNPPEILNIIQELENNNDSFYNLFLLNLYLYQIEHEAKYLWNQKDIIYNAFKTIIPYEQYIKNYIDNIITSDYEFQVLVSSKYLNDFNGIIDIYEKTNKTIIELKFTKSIGLIHYLQVFFYNFIKNKRFDKLETMYIINLLEGKKYNITLNSTLTSFDLLLMLAKILNTTIKNLVIMYDLETTGLINEDNYPEIIDRSFYEMNLDCSIDEGLIKTKEKLPEFISNLTNITDEMLNKQGELYEIFFNKFTNLNNYFDTPIYLAHNGTNFDHKIMTHYNLLDKSRVKFLDTRQIIMNFDKSIKGKLSEMYKQVTGKECLNAHRARADVDIVVEIFNKLDIKNKMKI